jgi:hypothetical protein
MKSNERLWILLIINMLMKKISEDKWMSVFIELNTIVRIGNCISYCSILDFKDPFINESIKEDYFHKSSRYFSELDMNTQEHTYTYVISYLNNMCLGDIVGQSPFEYKIKLNHESMNTHIWDIYEYFLNQTGNSKLDFEKTQQILIN